MQLVFGGGSGNPLQYSWLENPSDGGAWWATVHGVTKSWTWLSDFPFTFHFHALEKEMEVTPVFLLRESRGWGSLVGCCLWGHTESDTTEVTQQEQQQQLVCGVSSGSFLLLVIPPYPQTRACLQDSHVLTTSTWGKGDAPGVFQRDASPFPHFSFSVFKMFLYTRQQVLKNQQDEMPNAQMIMTGNSLMFPPQALCTNSSSTKIVPADLYFIWNTIFSDKIPWLFLETRLPTQPLLSVQFSSVAQSCLILCDPMDCSMPGLPVHHQLPEFTQTHVHWVGDAIQPSHPLSSPSPPALNLSQHQGLFQWVSSSHQMAKVLEFQLQHQSFQWTPRTDFP